MICLFKILVKQKFKEKKLDSDIQYYQKVIEKQKKIEALKKETEDKIKQKSFNGAIHSERVRYVSYYHILLKMTRKLK